MDNINIEEYIKDLSPELQEKARACKSTDELLKLASANRIPLPDETLEIVAGGSKGNAPRRVKISHSGFQDTVKRTTVRYVAVHLDGDDNASTEWEADNLTFDVIQIIRDGLGISGRRNDMKNWGTQLGGVKYYDPDSTKIMGRSYYVEAKSIEVKI